MKHPDHPMAERSEHESRRDEVPLEEQCIECGDRGHDRCSCCGHTLCGMHNEVQAGFCSSFSTHELSGYVVIESDRDNEIKHQLFKLDETQKMSGCLTEYDEGFTAEDMQSIVVMRSMPDEEPEFDPEKAERINECICDDPVTLFDGYEERETKCSVCGQEVTDQ